jgi:hypothetical protein
MLFGRDTEENFCAWWHRSTRAIMRVLRLVMSLSELLMLLLTELSEAHSVPGYITD